MAQASPEINLEEFFRTNDMAMATYLKLKGHSVQTLVWSHDVCFWVFRVTDALLEETEVFLEGGARVEPKEYNRNFNDTKREFYDSKESRPRDPGRRR